jgi:hypothetical protein
VARRPSQQIPASPGEIQYLLSLETYPSQEALADVLGTSARYIRWMLSGRKPGLKHGAKIHKLFEYHRRRGTKQVIRRVARPRRDFVPMSSVMKVLRHVFQPTDARAVPNRTRVWQERRTRFAAKERRLRGKFDSWDGFSIVLAQGQTDSGVASIRRYKPRGGGQFHLDFTEEREFTEDVERDEEVDEIEGRWEELPDKHRAVVSHLPIDEWIKMIGDIAGPSFLINFWVSRFSERPAPGAFGLARDPGDPETRANVEAVSRDDAESATADDGHFEYTWIGLYAFTGWNRKSGKKAPRQ